MDINLTASFYDSTKTPLALPEPRQVDYEITALDNNANSTTFSGSVTAPAGVSTYTFDVALPLGTTSAQGALLAGDFQTFSCEYLLVSTTYLLQLPVTNPLSTTYLLQLSVTNPLSTTYLQS